MVATNGGRPRATDRGLALVRVIADHPTGISLADAARAVELTPSTALRQLRAIEAAGFARRGDDGDWRPGAELLRIARSLSATAPLTALAQPLLDRLAADHGESAYLAEPASPARAVYVAMQTGSHAIRHVSWLGQTVSRRGTAVGAALAARVDGGGVAVRRDAVEDGITAISAPVRGPGGAAVAAISVIGPTFRVDATIDRLRADVAAAAAALSTALGHSPTPR